MLKYEDYYRRNSDGSISVEKVEVRNEDLTPDEMLDLYSQRKLSWFSKDQQRFLIQDMTDTHLQNVVSFINGIGWGYMDERVQTEYHKCMRGIMTHELKKRGLRVRCYARNVVSPYVDN